MYTREATTTVVHELIETCNERETGYLNAAENVKDPELAALFREYAMDSRRFAEELIPYYSESDFPEDVGKGPMGSIFQGWMKVKEKLTGGNPQSVINDCIFGEKAAVKVYENGFKDELPAEIDFIAKRQLLNFQNAILKLEGLKNRYE